MKSFFKKLLVTLLAATTCLGCWTGCGGGNYDDGPVIEAGDIPEGVVISENGKEVYKGTKEGKTKLEIGFAEAGYGARWLQVLSANFVDAYDQYWISLSGDPGLTESVSTKLQSGANLADLYFVLASNSLVYSQSGWLEDLSDVYASKPDGEDRDTVYDKMKEKWQYHCWEPYLGELKQYVYPWTEAITGIAYNKGMFDEYGWEIPTTVDDLVALCNKIKTDTNDKVAPFVYPGQTGGYFYMVYTWWLQASGYEGVEEYFKFEDVEVFNPEKQPAAGKLAALEAFTEVFGPDVDFSLEGSMSKNHIEAQIAFLRGEAAMIPNGSWIESEMIEDMPDGFEMRFMGAPYIDSARKNSDGSYEKYTMACSPDYAMVPAKATNKEGAKKFLSYVSNDRMLQLFTKYAGTLRPFEYDLEPIYDELTEFTKSALEITDGATMWFETTRSELYKKGYVQCFVPNNNPFPALIFGPNAVNGTTPEKYCLSEYAYALQNWDAWMASVK